MFSLDFFLYFSLKACLEYRSHTRQTVHLTVTVIFTSSHKLFVFWAAVLFFPSLGPQGAGSLAMLLNTHSSLHSKLRQKSCAAVQPDAQLVTMTIFSNATLSQSLPLLRHHLNELQTLNTNEGRGKNGSTGFQ